MPGHHKIASLSHHFRRMRGGSQSNLVLADDGLFYVVKFLENLQGPNLLFNESAGSELFSAAGLRTPHWQPLLLSESFIEQNPAMWIQGLHGRLRPKPGLCFGSQFLGLDGVRTLEVLSGRSYKLIQNRADFWLAWVIDACAEQCDVRQSLFTEETDLSLHATFIDHGSLFKGADGNKSHDIRASRYLDLRIYPDLTLLQQREIESHFANLDTETLHLRIMGLPEVWKTASVLENFAQTLHRLSSSSLVRNLLDAMSSFVRSSLTSSQESAGGYPETEPGHRVGLLHLGVHPGLRKQPQSSDGFRSLARGQEFAG